MIGHLLIEKYSSYNICNFIRNENTMFQINIKQTQTES